VPEVAVRISRRALLAVAAWMPVGYAVETAAAATGRIVSRAAVDLRPGPAGTTATRCAACGAGDHAMLDPRCPAARKVR
jgi:hypothetical protein